MNRYGRYWRLTQERTNPRGRGVKSGTDEMSKSQIEKRKRNIESTSRVSRREKRNVEICFLVREENENFCKKNGEILNIFSSFEMRREIQKYFL